MSKKAFLRGKDLRIGETWVSPPKFNKQKKTGFKMSKMHTSHQLASVAVIPDGNRRYAARRHLPLSTAYLAGFKKVREFLGWAHDGGVRDVTFWALSLDNFSKRSQGELTVLFKLMSRHIDKALDDAKAKEYNCRIKFFGKTSILPANVQAGIAKLEEKTSDYKDYTLNVGIAYNGRDELLQASKKLARDIAAGKIEARKVDEKAFENYLYFPADPQLIIRTGNVQRLSGFLPWQNTYSELYFSPKLWPEFTKEDFADAKNFYETTEQRFGR